MKSANKGVSTPKVSHNRAMMVDRTLGCNGWDLGNYRLR